MADNKIRKDTVSEREFEKMQETGQKPRQDQKGQKDPAGSKAHESCGQSAQRVSPGRMPLFGR